MLRLIRRTLCRVISRKKLWNGNREALTNLLKPNAEQNIILWAWNAHASNRRRYQQLFKELPAIEKIRIGSPLQVNRFLKSFVD